MRRGRGGPNCHRRRRVEGHKRRDPSPSGWRNKQQFIRRRYRGCAMQSLAHSAVRKALHSRPWPWDGLSASFPIFVPFACVFSPSVAAWSGGGSGLLRGRHKTRRVRLHVFGLPIGMRPLCRVVFATVPTSFSCLLAASAPLLLSPPDPGNLKRASIEVA